MNEEPLILAIDQGTTSSRAIVFNTRSEIVAVAQQEFPQIYPDDGWVEHDPEAIWSTALKVTQQAIEEAENKGGKVSAIGITNQRETTVVWDKETGKTIYNAIVWQDRRTAERCHHLREQGMEEMLSSRTGLLLDPYFSASKIAWILDNCAGARERAKAGKLAFGTIDSFLIWRLTGGNVHATDVTNASRTNLFNIQTMQWDDELLELFNIPRELLPDTRACTADYGETDKSLFRRAIPILGVAGDQQAATIGQCCFQPGQIKSTFGTGCFVLINTGDNAIASKNRLLTTVAYQINDTTHYALEGSVFIAGAGVQWLRDGLGIIASASKTESMAQSKDSNSGLYIVPAFTGMGAPYWEPHARGSIFGITRDTGPVEMVRSILESVCFQNHDLLNAMTEDGCPASRIRVDGGMVANNWMLQFLADIIGIDVDRPQVMETTALGAAYLAGLQLGIYSNIDEINDKWQKDKSFRPNMKEEQRELLLKEWHKAVNLTLSWAKN
jgi:glycerol kinase